MPSPTAPIARFWRNCATFWAIPASINCAAAVLLLALGFGGAAPMVSQATADAVSRGASLVAMAALANFAAPRRRKLREAFGGLPEEPCGDWCMYWCCNTCAVVSLQGWESLGALAPLCLAADAGCSLPLPCPLRFAFAIHRSRRVAAP